MNITYPNSKGQIVIPIEYRKKLGIDESVAILMKLVESRIILNPMGPIIPKIDKESNFKTILDRTRGIWGEETKKEKELEKQKKETEYKAWQERNQEW